MCPLYAGEIRKVMVLYTGGTIGMVKNEEDVYVPAQNRFTKKIRSYPELNNEEGLKKYFEGKSTENYLMMPRIHGKYTILYKIKECIPLMDSSNMSVEDWVRIAKNIQEEYYNYDGFVVLHGTDTLAYTASALSFMLEGLGKTVVLTGSQIPIFEARSDAKDNFIASMVFSSCYHIPEVCVCFANKLLRGNRTVKFSSNHLDAFKSPNYSPLGEAGIHFRVNHHQILRRDHAITLKVHTVLNENVGMLHLFPTVSLGMLKGFLRPPIRGVVLLSYGIGNIPSNRKDLLGVLADAVRSGIIIVNISECCEGSVNSAYETGKALEDLGIIAGHDMTWTAALSKLAYVLGLKDLNLDQRKELMKTNLCGELTNG